MADRIESWKHVEITSADAAASVVKEGSVKGAEEHEGHKDLTACQRMLQAATVAILSVE
jgi:hypothetical protein